MITPLNALLVAEAPAQPVLDSLRRAGYDPRPHYVTTPEALGAALIQRSWDVVVARHGLPALSVWDALGGVRRQHLHTPFIVVGDGLGEDEVVALIEAGANDVIRSPQLERLGSSTAKALRRYREARAPRSDEGGVPTDPGFQALAEHMPIGLYRSTEDGRILYANPALARILGRPSMDDLLGAEVVSSITYPRESFVERISEEGTVQNLEACWQRANGETVYTRENTRAVRDEDGTLLYYEGTMEDITEERTALLNEQRRVEQLEAIVRFSAAVDAAQSSEALHHAIVRAVEETLQADAAVLVQREDGRFEIQAWSETISEEGVRLCTEAEVWASYPAHSKPLLLRDEQAMTGSVLVEPLRTFMQQAGLRALGSFPLLYRGEPLGMIVTFFRKPHTFTDGELRIAETLAWHVAVALSRWQAECELRDSETSLRTIADATGHVLYRRRTETDAYDYVSASIRKLTGYSKAELQHLGGLDALIETRDVIKGAALREGGVGEDEHYLALYHLRTRSGELRWVEDSAYPWIDESGQPVGLVGVLQDVTERRLREQATREQSRRSLAQQRAVSELSTLELPPEDLLERAAEVAAQTTGTSRVGLWIKHGGADGLHHRGRYVLESGRYEPTSAFPAEAVLTGAVRPGEERVLVLNDTTDETSVPSEALGAYCEREHVGALLAAPVRQQGREVGLVVFEQVGAARTWTPDEQEFAEDVAALVALMIEHMRRARAETALRSSELRYRAISELAADYAYSLSVGAEGSAQFEWATKAFERISGYAPEEIADLAGLMQIVHEEDRPSVGAQLERLREGHTIDLEIRIRTKSGKERWISHRSRPVVNSEGLVTHVYSSGQDITDRKRFETELIAAREQAEEMARLKSAFLANMSHEIRTPLTGILGFAGVLAEEVDDEHREFVQLIEKSGRRLLDTLNSVLDLAQLESDGVHIAAGPLDVVDEISQVVQLLAPLAEEKGVALHLDAEGDEVIAPLDAACLNRILHNLVGNAIKFTEEGRVVVAVRPGEDHVHIGVTDTGIGIDEEFVPHLFEEFKQESTGQGRSHEGSGLGLAITRKLVELMGGSIGVESEKGRGSVFTIRFPRITSPPLGGDGQALAAKIVEPEPLDVAAPAAGDPADPLEIVESDSMDDASDTTLTEESPTTFTEGDVAPQDRSQEKTSLEETAALDTFEPEPLFASDLLDEIELIVPEHPESADDTWTFYDDFTAVDTDDLLGAMSVEEVTLETFADESLAHDLEDLDSTEAESVVPEAEPGSGERLDAGPAELPPEEAAVDLPPEAAQREPVGAVLVVEDNDETRLLIERVLQGTYHVEAVADARTALQRMASRPYDALVLDINLGGRQTGVDILRVARSLPGYKQVVAVALTAYALPGDSDRFLDEGFDRYVSKPFTKRGLLDALAMGKTKVAERS